jgi:cell wall-associated NlpC family hydrolase
MTLVPDPRLTLARGDIAARALIGMVPAERYLDTTDRQAIVPSTALRRAPSADAEQLDQLLFGEVFAVLEQADGWAFGQARRDGYVGYVAAGALGEPGPAPTHFINALRSYGYSQPSIKSRPTGLYSMNTLISEADRDGRFVKAAGAGWFVAEHLAPIGSVPADPVAVAERFVGTPYHWGGRESLGLDCSGLVQQAFYATARSCPRDSDQQAAMGVPVETVRRGDLVFWRGHVAMMTSDDRIIHASGFHMEVVIEPLAEAIARIDSLGGGQPTAYRRV